MILSHKYKFIYFKAIKVAGTSTEVALAEHCGPLDTLTTILPKIPDHHPRNQRKFFNHIKPLEVKNLISKTTWDSYIKVSVVRNPYDVMISRYWYFHVHVAKKNKWKLLAFPEWLESKNQYSEFANREYYFNNNKPICDFYIRFENLRNDINAFCDLVNMPYPKNIIKAKSNIRTDKKHYSKYYTTNKSIKTVYDLAKETIDYFGYKFEDLR